MKTTFYLRILFALLFSSTIAVRAQGTFGNLGFEQATIVHLSGPQYSSASAFPNWNTYINGASANWAFYNAASLGAAAVSIHDSSSPLQPLVGNYSAYLQGSAGGGPPASAALARTSMVPVGTQALLFRAWGNDFQVSMNGQALSLQPVSSAGNYTLFGADISSFAGSANELRFTALSGGNLFLDSILFSTVAVPEPGTWALGTMALAGVWLFRRREENHR